MKTLPILAIALCMSLNANAADNVVINNKVDQLKQLLNEVPQELSASNNTQVLVGNEGKNQFQQNDQLVQMAKALSAMLDNANSNVSTNGVPGLQWQKADLSTVPTSSLYNAGNTTETVTICRAAFMGNHAYGTAVYPGMLSNHGCYISYAGYAFSLSNFQVLTGSNTDIKWIPYDVVAKKLKEMNAVANPPMTKPTPMNLRATGDLIAYPPFTPRKNYSDVVINNASPVAGGYDNGSPVMICRATYQNKLYAGKLVNDSCNISIGDKEIVVANIFDLMFYGKAKVNSKS